MKYFKDLRSLLKWVVSLGFLISVCLIDLLFFFFVATKKQFDDTVAIHPTSAEGELMPPFFFRGLFGVDSLLFFFSFFF